MSDAWVYKKSRASSRTHLQYRRVGVELVVTSLETLQGQSSELRGLPTSACRQLLEAVRRPRFLVASPTPFPALQQSAGCGGGDGAALRTLGQSRPL